MTTYLVEDTNYMRDDSCTEESSVQKKKKPAWAPCFFIREDKEVYYYVGQKIIIQEGLDSYGGMIWPAALSLCHYLDTHREQLNLVDKTVLEIGAGTGLVSIVASLLGALVTATDLPEVLGNMRFNLSRNTRGHCRYTPQLAVLSWGYDLERTYPTSVYRYDYVLAADVVYHHDFLDELLVTMKHFCIPGTTLIWANKIRYEADLKFVENFKKAFHTTLLAEDEEMKIFIARSKEEER
ncbi:protein-lysine methyltransferase METTL21C [Scomber japonicus]|uniref:protein-lysine methyltransferase METTL21C n=1 Tax=Scomber japonicus TaxID=13676 RepID=UPI002304DCFD|nr:protein-lysine methyltransferase METTL21C [Scomber japonicus]